MPASLDEVPDLPALQGTPETVHERTAENAAPAAGAGNGSDDDLQKLKKLLFLREMELLRTLERRLDDPVQHARETSEIVAEAMLLRAQKDNMLYTALEPLAEKLFKDALRKSPMDFVNALFPIMGPTIRRSIAETFRSMLESFHKTVELVFSWKGLRWRWEALRTGMSFSEIVLLRTLLYRVEQIFFIHAETGLPLCHVVNEGVATQDADMVSAMLTAIQDFARDCFVNGQECLDSLHLGEFGILVERGTTAYLACVVRGTVPLEFKQRLREVMAALQIKYTGDLESFAGDTEKFAAVRWDLEDLLDTRLADQDAPLPLWVRRMPVAVAVLLIAGASYGGYAVHRRGIERRIMEENLVQVGKAPGILLVEARRDDADHWEVIYQKDPLAQDPKSLLDARGIDPGRYTLRVIPFVSYEAEMVTRRVRERIDPPENVSMEFGRDGTLHLRGKAPMGWILQARQGALALPGVEKVDTSGLTDPRIDALKRMMALVESTVVEFPLGRDTPVPEDAAKLTQAMDALAEIKKLADGMNVTVSLTVYGHADTVGSDKRNYEISLARTRTIAAMLYARGSSIPIAMYGLGADYAHGKGAGDQASRKVELRVHLAQLPSDDGMPILLR
jgi:OOP family OmpA-OmpF porin